MTKLQVIERAKSYMDMLSSGIDPISGNAVPDDSVLSQERLRKCFAFVSVILKEIADNGGEVINEDNKAAFCVTEEQKGSIEIQNTPITQNSFIKNINSVINTKRYKKFSGTSLNIWLVENGYLSESIEPKMTNSTVKHLTPLSASVGIIENEYIDSNTGEVKKKILYTETAQRFILEHIEEMTSLRRER